MPSRSIERAAFGREARAAWRASRIGVLMFACACGARAVPPSPAPSPRTAGITPAEAPGGASSSSARAVASVAITLRPEAEPAPVVHVKIHATAPASDVARWSMAMAATGSGASMNAGGFKARDARGPVEIAAAERDGQILLELARETSGELEITYDVPARADTGDVRVDATHFRASGEPLVLVPVALLDRAAPVTLRVDASALGATGAASSFGVGETYQGAIPLRELRTAAYIAGPMGHARFDAQEGHDEVAWVGYSAFDPRWVAAEVATLRSAIGDYFGDGHALPFTMLLLTERRVGAPFVVSPRTRSLLVVADLDAPWTVSARAPIARALVHRYVGGALRVGPADPSREAEGYWFSEGVARFVAREVLFQSGTITPDEYADDANLVHSFVTTAARRVETNEDLAADAGDSAARALMAARGALYATRVDALVRRKSSGKRSLRDVLRGLLAEAAAGGARLLPVDAWTSRLAREIGNDESRVFEDAIQGGIDPPLPDDALGPCFARGRMTFESFDVGFDDEATAVGGTIAGLREAGPAARAGLRADDVVVAVRGGTGRVGAPMRVTVRRDARDVEIVYRPVGATRNGIGWVRKRGVPDAACRR